MRVLWQLGQTYSVSFVVSSLWLMRDPHRGHSVIPVSTRLGVLIIGANAGCLTGIYNWTLVYTDNGSAADQTADGVRYDEHR